MLEEMKSAIETAAGTNQKIAMFHLQILKNAEALDGVNAKSFCQELGVRETYATEFQKMLSLARLMKAHGIRLVQV